MESIFSRDLMIDPSMTDKDAKLSYYKAFMLFMDIAAEHAERLNIGTALIRERNLFWLTVKTRIRYYRRPYQSEIVTFSTWPEEPDEMRSIRSYTVKKGEELLVDGKTEWAVLETDTGNVHPIADVFPEGLEFMPSACPDDFARIEADFSQAERFEYVVRPTDIDLGRHMNNTAYIRAAFDTISNRELKGMDIRAIDVIFLSPCMEGDTLSIARVQADGEVCVKISKEEKPVFLMKISFG